ncbi:response regulator [Nakamurella flavida]|uniref:Response regulator n=1 Tax=Nakamurella flavida TaxID=363630 RepID=A0A939C2T8_9ACTN|nr:response regulator [Nakamurella flavida]MBM9476371.1 response regulator [Nakamurella flavida]MDP9779529.1 DNA-binding response OmpR family regulator [Nakamurella flavida]
MSTATADEGTTAGPGVVIADDDTDIRRLIELAARRAGVDVLAAVDNGASALDAIREHRPALAVLDVAMPRLTGLQVCAAVRADHRLEHMRIMLLSAAVHAEAVAAGYDAQADLYATKPFSPRSLAAQITALTTMGARP